MSNRKKKARSGPTENDEVEELLRAAEDDVFLKMSLNSHTLRGSSSHIIPPDLDRRLQALKSNSKSQPTPSIKPQIPKNTPNFNTSNDDDDDFLGRFEALKKTLPSYQNHGGGGSVKGEEEEEEDEVEKVIRWAMDAARLDPSPVSDTEEEEDQESDEDYDSEEDNDKKRPKGKKK